MNIDQKSKLRAESRQCMESSLAIMSPRREKPPSSHQIISSLSKQQQSSALGFMPYFNQTVGVHGRSSWGQECFSWISVYSWRYKCSVCLYMSNSERPLSLVRVCNDFLSLEGSRSPWVCSQATGQGCSLIWNLNWGRIHYQTHSCGCQMDSVHHGLLGSGLQFLTGCWPKASLTFLLHEPLHRAGHNMAEGFPQNAWAREWERAPKKEVTVFLNLISEVTPHHFCHRWFIRSKSIHELTLKKRTLHKGVNTRSQDHCWSLEAAYPRPQRAFIYVDYNCQYYPHWKLKLRHF